MVHLQFVQLIQIVAMPSSVLFFQPPQNKCSSPSPGISLLYVWSQIASFCHLLQMSENSIHADSRISWDFAPPDTDVLLPA